MFRLLTLVFGCCVLTTTLLEAPALLCQFSFTQYCDSSSLHQTSLLNVFLVLLQLISRTMMVVTGGLLFTCFILSAPWKKLNRSDQNNQAQSKFKHPQIEKHKPLPLSDFQSSGQ